MPQSLVRSLMVILSSGFYRSSFFSESSSAYFVRFCINRIRLSLSEAPLCRKTSGPFAVTVHSLHNSF